MIRSFDFYINEKKAVKQQPDKEMALSLMKKAENRLNYIRLQSISKDNAGFVFEDIYEGLREAAQAILSVDGYKPYSHEVLIAYLKEKCPEIDHGMLEKFDGFRKSRNSAVYEAEEISEEKAESALCFLKEILPELKSILNKRIK